MVTYDFFIPEQYRGQIVALPQGRSDWPKEHIDLSIPAEAFYLDINPLEDEDEHQGCQDETDRQELNYYDKNNRYISTQNLEYQIITWRLMCRLELLLKKQY
jgi:hypothetical protein